MRVRGVTGGAGGRVAVPVGVGGTSGVFVADGVTVGPMEMGRALQAVIASVISIPKIAWVRFIAVLILVK